MACPESKAENENQRSTADTSPSTVMILAGEPSGDVHAADLIRQMKTQHPGIQIVAMGGPNMEQAGATLFFSIENLSAMGIVEVICQFRQIRQAFETFRRALVDHEPDLLILVDYPGFNLRAAAHAKTNHAIPVLYYIAPKVWAWNKGRLSSIAKFVDHVALIFPFEPPLYEKANIPASYVGNPLMDHLPAKQSPKKRDSRFTNGLTIGILPGSRPSEVNRLLDTILQAAVIITKTTPGCRFLISCASSISPQTVDKILLPHRYKIDCQVIHGNPSPIFDQADLVIAASGTVTLEAALHEIPCVLVYKMSGISYQIARRLVTAKYAGLANLIADAPVMPELLQKEANPQSIAECVHDMTAELDTWKEKLKPVKTILGRSGAAEKTASIALSMIKKTDRII